jgi:protein TonB
MPHALLLSPDDQAVSAITAVLEEMSVSCERPLDGASAAQKLNAHSFDLVLVDCENLPAAKLIFDVCRRGKNGKNPVPIAIVDGRAGLPTAFRLGAELILTKPVAKDQARSTIRTAVSRVRKDVLAKESVPAPTASAAIPSAVALPERAQAAAAAMVSSSLCLPPANFADPAPGLASTADASALPSATLCASALTTKMQSALDEIDAAPATPKSEPEGVSLSGSASSERALVQTVSENSTPTRPPSDDPVLAELERMELEQSESAGLQGESPEPEKAEPEQAASESSTPVFSSYAQGQKKKRGPVVALLMLALAGAGFYAAWTYQPGFRTVVQPQIDRVRALAGMGPRPSAPTPAKPSTQSAPAPAPTAVPAPPSPTAPNQTQSTVPDSAGSSATVATTGSGTRSATTTAPVQPAAIPAAAVTPAKSGAATAELPWENSTVILSSKGAERRLAHSVPAPYPVEAKLAGTEGTVVLKVVVDETGKVDGLRLVEGNATLATAAIQAVKEWRYRPYVRDGRALPFQTVVIVDFQRP